MLMRIISLSLILFMAANASADLIGHWKFDETSGTTASDSSGNGNNGTFFGNPGPKWITGKIGGALEFDGTDDYVQVKRTVQDDMTLMCWIKTSTDGSALTPAAAWRGTGLIWSDVSGTADDFIFAVYGKKLMFSTREDQAGPSVNDVVTGDWVHVAVTRVAGTDQLKIYINGQMDTQYNGTTTASLTANANINIGADTLDSRFYKGLIDDVRFYTNCLTQNEITEVINSSLAQGTAYSPFPTNGATDVAKNVTLSWEPGKYIAEGGTHNVFFGTDFNDVNDATVSSHPDVTVSLGQLKDVNNFNPGTLEYGKTYYWRVDEVNAPASPGQYKGPIWSFTVEPVALKLTKENIIKVTVKNSAANNDPNNTINEAGLDPNTDLHSTGGCWVSGSANAADPAWIRYDFDRLYKIHEMFVWNYNVVASSKYGFKSVRIEYSTNGSSWTDLNTVTEFASGTSKVGYACNTTVPFNDIVASSVRITALSIQSGTYTKAGLAEVRFTIIPTYARIPSPGIGETDFSIDRVLSWRQGREADKHDVYISTDSAAVLNHSTPAHTVTVNNYSPLLDFGRTYYWSVTEVSNTMTPSRWAGDIWDFTTAEYGSLDDFEDYNGVPGREIYSFWLDGYESITNGSIIGLNNSPYVETTIVQHGKQSAPISYDNTGTLEPAATYSEVTRTFDTALNLKVNGADSLRLYYRGQAITFGELSGCIAMSGEGADIGGTSDQFRYAYKTLTGNGSITARVDSVENRNAATEAGIMIRNTIDANSAFAMANLIPNGTPSFQRRLTAGASAASTNLTAIGNPYWVKITRNGSTFTAQRSADGTNWVSFETDANKPTTATITMGNSVLIGFVVSSHVADVIAAATFSGVATSGNISTGAWTVAPIGDATQADGLNTIDALYVVAEDNAGNKSKVFAPGDAVGSAVWMQLTIPYSQFTSVDMSKLKKLTIGVGDLAATAKGKGMIYIDNISYGHTIVK